MILFDYYFYYYIYIILYYLYYIIFIIIFKFIIIIIIRLPDMSHVSVPVRVCDGGGWALLHWGDHWELRRHDSLLSLGVQGRDNFSGLNRFNYFRSFTGRELLCGRHWHVHEGLCGEQREHWAVLALADKFLFLVCQFQRQRLCDFTIPKLDAEYEREIHHCMRGSHNIW